MKTLKPVMIVLIVIIAVTGISISTNLNADSLVKANQPSSAVYVTFDQAILNNFLVMAMYEQLDEDLLGTNQQFYTEPVLYLGSTVYITGTYGQWYLFFEPQSIFQALD